MTNHLRVSAALSTMLVIHGCAAEDVGKDPGATSRDAPSGDLPGDLPGAPEVPGSDAPNDTEPGAPSTSGKPPAGTTPDESEGDVAAPDEGKTPAGTMPGVSDSDVAAPDEDRVITPPEAISHGVELVDASDLLDFSHQASRHGGDIFAGVGWLDYDNDDDLDLFVPNGPGSKNGLFSNNGDGTFTNVAEAAGVAGGTGHDGVAVADIDNDGHVDLYVTGGGGWWSTGGPTGGALFHNQGDGTFVDITRSAGVAGPITYASATFGDIDNDGDVDLFIGGLGDLENTRQDPNKLYRNEGDLTFTDISSESGVGTAVGACAATFTQYDDDGFIDLVIANCNNAVPIPLPTPFEVYKNDGDGTFTDIAVTVGLGRVGFWMGLAIGDVDNDGDLDIMATSAGGAIGAFGGAHALYLREDDGAYTDIALAAGVASWEFGWGNSLADYDNDGDLDLYFIGSAPGQPFNLEMGCPGRLFFNEGDGTFSAPVVPVDTTNWNTTGVAHGDFDDDGFTDLAVGVDETPREIAGVPDRTLLLHNQGNDNLWIKVALQGTTSNRSAIGAHVFADAGGGRQMREMHAGTSFESQHTPWPIFGLGTSTSAEVSVKWPTGVVESFGSFQALQKVVLVEGEGQTEAASP